MSAKCDAILDMMAKALDDDKISESAFRAFNSTFDPAKGNVVDAVASMRKATTRENFNRARDVERSDAIKQAIDSGDSTEGIVNLFAMAFSARSETANIPTRANSIEGQLRRMTGETDAEFGTKVWDWFQRDPKANEEFTRAMLDLNYNSEKYPEFRKMADNYSDALDEARRLANKEGMDIGDVRNKSTGQGYLPQSHNANELLAMGKPNWKNLIRNKLDYLRMGFKDNTGADFEKMLDEVFDTITSNGLNKKNLSSLSDGERGIGKRMSEQRQEERFLHFADGDRWIEYAKEINKSTGGLRATGANEVANVYTTLRTHLRGMSNDIAVLQVMGSNPDKMFSDAIQYAKDAGKFENTLDFEGRLKAMYNTALGRADMNLASTKGAKSLGHIAGTFRSMMVASQLGGAVVSSLVDTATSAIASKMVGNSAIKTEVKGLMALAERAFKGGSAGEKEMFAIRLGFASDAFMSEIRNTRWAETGGGSPAMQKIAEQVLRVSGLLAWTNARRTVWKMELAGSSMADNFGKNLDDFTFGKRMKKQYGITNDEWLSLGDTHKTSFNNGGYLDTTKLYETNPDLALRLQDLMEMETNYAVVMPDARTRAITTGGMAKGTVGGEAIRTVGMFKSFPISLMTMQFARISQIEGKGGKIAYSASAFVGLSTMGVGVVQLKDMMAGKEPMALDEPALYKRGIGMGGGLGLFSDLLIAPQTRFGQSASEAFFLGIGAQPLNDVKALYDATVGLDEHADFGAKATETALKYVPSKNLWYTRLAYERAISDQLKSLTNDKHHAKLQRQKQKMAKETGQGYYWEPTK